MSERHLANLRYCFIDSKILKPEMINNDLYITFPKIKQTELLYRMNRDGCKPDIFHRRCDNRGPTMILISANNGYIFGGYNPTSWISEYCYSECDDAFLFSITDPSNHRKPFKCVLSKSKTSLAIKQSQSLYSPGFGEANNCDLFLAFKNLKKSYSRLGNVYHPPFEYS